MQSLEKGGLKTVFKCFYQPVPVGISFFRHWVSWKVLIPQHDQVTTQSYCCEWKCTDVLLYFSCWEETMGHVFFLNYICNPFCYFIGRRPVIGHAPFHRKSRFLYWFFWTTAPWATKSNPAHPWASFWRWQSLWRKILPLVVQKKRDEQAKGLVLLFIIFLKI